MPIVESQYEVREREQAPIDIDAAIAFVEDARFGAAALFIGKVRDHSHGRASLGVSYDVYQPLAKRIFAQIAEESVQSVLNPSRPYPIKVSIQHAAGKLEIGDTAVVVAVGSPHRAESLQLCAQLIERVKHEAPIWKKEHFSDGDSEWVQGCALCVPSIPVVEHSANERLA